MRDLDHPNVMSLIGVCHDESTPYIVMPYMANGSVLAHLKKERKNLLVSVRGTQGVSC